MDALLCIMRLVRIVSTAAWAPWLLVAWSSASTSACIPRPAPSPGRPLLAITDVSVVDVDRGRTLPPRTVLVDEGRIVAIDLPGEARIPAGARRIDGRGRFLIPGLVDLHVHLFNHGSRRPPSTWAFPLFVASGVTGVREMGARPASIALVNEWRRAAARGALLAPRILAAGVVVKGRSPAEAARSVNEAAEAGADFLKIYSELPEASWQPLLAAAHRRGLPVLGHVPATVPLLAAAAAGQRDNEHLTQAFEACTASEPSWLAPRRALAGEALLTLREAQEERILDAFDQPACDRVAAALAALGQVQVPTLILAFVEASPADAVANPADAASSALERDPRWPTLRADERARWSRLLASLTPHQRATAARRWKIARQITSTFHRAGVPLLAGTDAPMPRVYPGSSLHEELELLVASGLSPAAALRAATLAPAIFLGLAATLGSVAVGKRADLVLLDADPLLDIRNTRRIHAVLLDGRLLTRAALDALLAAAAQVARGPSSFSSRTRQESQENPGYCFRL